jgi:hypothetical protein
MNGGPTISDRQLLLAAFAAGDWAAVRLASPPLLADPGVMLRAASLHPSALHYAAAELCADRAFMLRVLATHGR